MAAATAGSEPRKRMTATQRRAQILQAARGVFVAQGVNGARTRDIAAAAGINEALLYRHFASKEELFQAAVVEPLQAAVAAVAVAASDPPVDASSAQAVMVDRTRLFISDLIGVMHEIAPLLGAMVFDGEELATRHYQESVQPVLRQVADLIRTNLGWWDHRDFDPDLLVRALFGSVWFETVSARLEGRAIDVPALADTLATVLVLGVASRPEAPGAS